MAFFYDKIETTSPNLPILLYEGPITLITSSENVSFNVRFFLHWLPSLKMHFKAVNIPVNFFKLISDTWNKEEIKLQIANSSNTAKTIITHVECGIDREGLIEGFLNSPLEIGDTENLIGLECHLVNFDDFIIRRPGGELTLEADNWKIIIRGTTNLDELVNEIKGSGGYAITHHVRIERSDRSRFSAEQIKNVLVGLHRFLSFIQGRKVNAILPVGFDETRNPKWRQWACWNIDTWQNVISWADFDHADYFPEAFVGFMRMWQDESWCNSLSLATHWYTEANRNPSGLEAGIVFTQMALELLAWEYFVEHNNGLTKEGFNRLRASDKIRLILTSHQVPLEIPQDIYTLSQCAKDFNWIDLADCITAMRNNVIHPKAKLRDRMDKENSPLLDIWKIGLWTLELLLLRMFRYTGHYYDRRKPSNYRGHVESVPWANCDFR